MSKKIYKKILSVFLMASIFVANFNVVNVQATSAKIETAIQWAINIANDNSHGYSQSNRNGPDYDCSSLVGAALNKAGFSNTLGFNTRNMGGILESIGFTKYNFPRLSNCQRGDILWRSGHTEMYLENGKSVGAYQDYGYTQTDDQNGREISIEGCGSNWTYIYGNGGNDPQRGNYYLGVNNSK